MLNRSTVLLPFILPFIIASLGGCTLDETVMQIRASFGDRDAQVTTTEAAVQPVADPNAIPWQLTPASPASVAQGEVTLVADVPGKGRVRGTQKALAQLDQRIVPYQKESRIVTSCRNAFQPQAKKIGAYSFEAAASGPQRRSAKGHTQQVFFRVFYADPKDGGVEVRQSAVDCTVSKTGELLEANPV